MKISIFTPTNNSQWLPNIYKCLLKQTHQNWEWVVVYNNGGVPLNLQDPRVKEIVLEYPTNEWVGPLKAIACSRCTSDVLLELDHDDLLMPTALEEVAKAFQDPEIGFVYSNTIHSWRDPKTGIDFQKCARFDERYGWKYREVEYDGHVLDEHHSFPPSPHSISKIWFAPNHLRAFRREIYNRVGGYNTKMKILDDLDLMCRMYQATKFKHIDKGLYIYRVHGENTWLRYNQEIQDNVYRIHDQYIDALARRWSDLNGLRKIELGGRMNAQAGYETVDLKDADIVWDLNKRWPFPDSSIGVVRAYDVIEHLHDPLHTMKELYRVLAPGGYALLQVPSTDGRGAFSDPTHVSFWNELSFHYYTKQSKSQWIDTPVRFQAARLYTGAKNEEGVCWTIAHLVSLKNGFRPAGLIEIGEEPPAPGPLYIPPTLAESQSVSIAPLKDKHKGETCWIVGKGPSIAHLHAAHFDAGPIIALKETIRRVQAFGLPNQIYSMQKDGCVTLDSPAGTVRPCNTCAGHNWQRYPVENPRANITVLFSQFFSSWCLHGRKNRYVFTDAELGYPGQPHTMSVLSAIAMAKHFGCTKIVMVCFDHVVNGALDTAVCVDNNKVNIDYLGYSRIDVVQARHHNLEDVKPKILNALLGIPHSFITPEPETPTSV